MIVSEFLSWLTPPGPVARWRFDGWRAILSRAVPRSSLRLRGFAVSSRGTTAAWAVSTHGARAATPGTTCAIGRSSRIWNRGGGRLLLGARPCWSPGLPAVAPRLSRRTISWRYVDVQVITIVVLRSRTVTTDRIREDVEWNI